MCSESVLGEQVVTVNGFPEDVDEVGAVGQVGCKRPVDFGFVHKGYDKNVQLE